MFHNSDLIRVLRDAETIVASELLSKNQKHTMLSALLETLPPAQMRDPTGDSLSKAITKALEKYELRTRPAREEEQGRKAEGVEKPTEVAAGSPKEATKATEGTTEGVKEQTEATGSVGRATGKRRPKESPAAPPTDCPC